MILSKALLALVAGALSLTTLTPSPLPGVAASEWEALPLGGRVLQLFTPASGAFFARTPDGLLRSDDGGGSWNRVNTPPGLQFAAVDPLDHTVLYVSADDGISKSADDAATWTLVLPTGERAANMAISPADRDLVYLALTGRGISADFRFLRSPDGGATWEQLEEHHNSLCGWGAPILVAHPADPNRLFRTASCYAGRSATVGDTLDLSLDRGASWAALFESRPNFPTDLVGGRGAAPARHYLGVDYRRDPVAWLYRSDDDGGTWTPVFTQPGATVGGLAYDPAAPDRVFLALGSGVKASPDGGATWTDLGRQDLGEINALVLGIDAGNLYAATDQGLWRLHL
jgi:photosystem II stability/assembly factor-like uncharacterized protein